ncbi:MAG: hypothetical protein ABII88_02880 [Candidatus Omnitrophota bacterium]
MKNRLIEVWKQRRIVVLFCLIALLYSLGGGGWLLLRRYAMPFVIASSLGWNWLLFFCLSAPLHLGYTEIVDANNWAMIALLGCLYGVSWYPVLKKRTLAIMALFAAVWCFAVWLCHYQGMNWQWVELMIGVCFGAGFLIADKVRSDG